MDQMQMSATERIEHWNNYLEEMVEHKTKQLEEEKQKTENFLNRMLPPSVASRLSKGLPVEPKAYGNVTIYFSDIVGFTSLSSQCTPLQVSKVWASAEMVSNIPEVKILKVQISQTQNVRNPYKIGDCFSNS